jgi:Zn ribbon nucleic-acid-binding protein
MIYDADTICPNCHAKNDRIIKKDNNTLACISCGFEASGFGK